MKVAIIGYGKMGHEIERILKERGHQIVLIVDKDSPKEAMSKESLSQADVAIEFSTPQTAYDNVIKCLEAGVGVVCGTTAWLDKYDSVKQLCEQLNGTFFYASNYSIGVNLFFKLNEQLAKMMNRFNEYDVTLNEVHHTQKLDAPSGTAITLAQGIVEQLDRKDDWYFYTGENFDPTKVEVTAQRRSNVAGTHTIVWESEDDYIELEHHAKNRRGLATGAVVAAEFIYGKRGVFSMDDILAM